MYMKNKIFKIMPQFNTYHNDENTYFKLLGVA